MIFKVKKTWLSRVFFILLDCIRFWLVCTETMLAWARDRDL